MDGNGDPVLTPEKIAAIIHNLTDARSLWVAYSGGVDSHVLLDLIVRAFAGSAEYCINALHVHHGISENADHWVKHCEQICADLKVPLTVLWVNGKVIDGRSPEEVAREARFSAFESVLKTEDCLLLAHHEADQAETILLRLFRGAGPAGLGGIPEKNRLGNSELIRPLLKFSKENILAYAKVRSLEWIDDESNLSLRFDRNFLRSEVMPLLNARWPSAVHSITRAGALCRETAQVIQSIAKEDLKIVQGKTPESLSVSALLALEKSRRRGVIRYWLQQQGFSAPSVDHMERIDREVLKAGPERKPKLKISRYEILRQKDELKAISLIC